MDPVALLRMAAESITAHKLRSSLVTVGILIGVTAVLVNAGLVEGFQAYFEKEIQALGSNFVTIAPAGSLGFSGMSLSEDDTLEPHVYDAVKRLPRVTDATASKSTYGTIKYMGEEEDVFVFGVEPGYLRVRNRDLVAGDGLARQDTHNAVVGDDVLNTSMRPVALQSQFELTLQVNRQEVTQTFRVKGISESMQNPLGLGMIYIPIRTLNEMLGEEGYSDITVFAQSIDDVEPVEQEVRRTLDRLLKVEPDRSPPVEDAGEGEFFAQLAPDMATGDEKYQITTQRDILDVSEEITGSIQMVLVAIAGISLLVGGIGIANVMLVTVAERTREIGVMKAVGAKNRHVLVSFLFEAALIGFIGGVAGLLLSAAAIFTTIPALFDVPGALSPSWVGIAIGISLWISLVSGLYPAIRASRMDPVEALRTE